jgi:HSP20 family protein
MKLDNLKQGLNAFLDSVSDGWQHVRRTAASALTGFKPGDQTNLPAKTDVDDMFYIPSGTWSMLGANLFEDERRVIVQLEVPGLERENFDIEVLDNTLVIAGEKRFEREATEGRYRVLQCAYGSFRRTVPLPVPVIPDQAQASYRNGVLRVELPKAEIAKPHKVQVKVE